ncbi:MAG: hypothetical protein ACOH2N_11945 [Devosia sp.]
MAQQTRKGDRVNAFAKLVGRFGSGGHAAENQTAQSMSRLAIGLDRHNIATDTAGKSA